MPIEQEEKEKAEKEKKDKEKTEREVLKKAMKNERKQLRTLCKDNEYFTEDADERVQNLTDLDRCVVRKKSRPKKQVKSNKLISRKFF